MTPEAVLQHYFGFEQFRHTQRVIIEDLLAGSDVFAILPTGGGKSVCYQVPGLMLPGMTVVVSPLISLMKDQVESLTSRGVCATFLNSSLSSTELALRTRLVQQGQFRFVYVAPERLHSPSFLQAVSATQVSLIAVDEAHCISEWGHDFRPQYRAIPTFIRKLSSRPPIFACTGTATQATQQDILSTLQLKQPKVHTQSFLRENLQYHTYHAASSAAKHLALFRVLKRHHAQSGIVYTATRAAAEQVSGMLSHLLLHQQANTLSRKASKQAQPTKQQVVAYYHGGMTALDRATVQQRFMRGACRVVVATNAFGMGIDKSNVRFVVHYHLPSSIENYYQEIGRAGRDGKTANCYLLYSPQDVNIHFELLRGSARQNVMHTQQKSDQLSAMTLLAQGERCTSACLQQYFGETTTVSCGHCSWCCQEHWHHPLLLGLTSKNEHQRLKVLQSTRLALAARYRCTLTQVMPDTILCVLALFHPLSAASAKQLPGIGIGWLETWWEKLFVYLQATSYCSHPPHSPRES